MVQVASSNKVAMQYPLPTTTKMTPFQALYGYELPRIDDYLPSDSIVHTMRDHL